MNDVTTIRIERAIIERMKNIKIAKHETYSEIINRLLDSFTEINESLESSKLAHTHEEEQKPSPKKKKYVPMSPYHERLTAIQNRMREVGAWDVETFQNGIAVRFIKELCGGDSRTIQKYYSDLETKWSIEH